MSWRVYPVDEDTGMDCIAALPLEEQTACYVALEEVYGDEFETWRVAALLQGTIHNQLGITQSFKAREED